MPQMHMQETIMEAFLLDWGIFVMIALGVLATATVVVRYYQEKRDQ